MKRVCAYRANKILFNFLKSNDLVGTLILPANICPDVVDTLLYAGCTLQFVDINMQSLCLDLSLAKQYAKEAKALLFVHTYGVEDSYAYGFERIKEINPNIAIIDDRCLCFPAAELMQSDADLVLYSTGEKKQVELGKGGIGYVADGWKYEDIMVPENSVLTNEQWNIDAQLLKVKTDEVIKHKNKLNAIYHANIPNTYQLSNPYQHWRFNIVVKNKAAVLEEIFNAGLFASGHYSPLADNCPNAQYLYEHVINLFNDFYFTEDKTKTICEIINMKIR